MITLMDEDTEDAVGETGIEETVSVGSHQHTAMTWNCLVFCHRGSLMGSPVFAATGFTPVV